MCNRQSYARSPLSIGPISGGCWASFWRGFATMLGAFGTMLGAMAHGFHWL